MKTLITASDFYHNFRIARDPWIPGFSLCLSEIACISQKNYKRVIILPYVRILMNPIIRYEFE